MSTLRDLAFYRRLRKFNADAKIFKLSIFAQRISESAEVDDEESSSSYMDFLSELVRKMSRRERQRKFRAILELNNFYATKFGPVVPTNKLRRTFKSLLFSTNSTANFSECKASLNRFGFAYSFERSYCRQCLDKLLNVNTRVNGKLVKNEIEKKILELDSLRMQLLCETLVALFNPTCGEDQDYLKLLWKAMPHPFISTTEMSALPKPFYKGQQLQLQELCDEYRKRNTIFEVPEVNQPRSLKHLSRVEARKSLSHGNSIGDDAVDSLHFPPVLKSFLKLGSF